MKGPLHRPRCPLPRCPTQCVPPPPPASPAGLPRNRRTRSYRTDVDSACAWSLRTGRHTSTGSVTVAGTSPGRQLCSNHGGEGPSRPGESPGLSPAARSHLPVPGRRQVPWVGAQSALSRPRNATATWAPPVGPRTVWEEVTSGLGPSTVAPTGLCSHPQSRLPRQNNGLQGVPASIPRPTPVHAHVGEPSPLRRERQVPAICPLSSQAEGPGRGLKGGWRELEKLGGTARTPVPGGLRATAEAPPLAQAVQGLAGSPPPGPTPRRVSWGVPKVSRRQKSWRDPGSWVSGGQDRDAGPQMGGNAPCLPLGSGDRGAGRDTVCLGQAALGAHGSGAGGGRVSEGTWDAAVGQMEGGPGAGGPGQLRGSVGGAGGRAGGQLYAVWKGALSRRDGAPGEAGSAPLFPRGRGAAPRRAGRAAFAAAAGAGGREGLPRWTPARGGDGASGSPGPARC